MSALGHVFVVTGQPTRSCAWANWEGGFNCNGLGYISLSENVNGSNWNSLVDGNDSDLRNWPAANTPGTSILASLCGKFNDVAGVTLWGNYIWRNAVPTTTASTTTQP